MKLDAGVRARRASVAVTKCSDRSGAGTRGRQQRKDMTGGQESERTGRHLTSAPTTQSETPLSALAGRRCRRRRFIM